MSPPTLIQHVRQTLGRALRETGQALDRVALKLASLAVTQKLYGEDEPVAYQDFLSRHRQQFPLLHSGRPVLHPQVAYVAPCATLIGSVTVHQNASIWYGAVLRADSCAHAESFKKSDEELLAESEASMQAIAAPVGTLATVTTTATESIDGGDAPTKDNDDLNDDTTAAAETIAATNAKGPFERPESKPGQAPTDSFYSGGGIVIGPDTNIQDGCILTARVGHLVIGQGVTVGHLAQIHSATIGDYSLIGMGSVLQEGCRIENESLVAAGAVVLKNQVVPSGELWVGNPARKLRNLTPQERDRLHYQSSEYVKVATTHQPVMELGGNLNDKMIDEAAELLSLQIQSSTSAAAAIEDEELVLSPVSAQADKDHSKQEEQGTTQDRQKVVG
jgi:carbonic anhydrase/acetyltransferase-like protein (isoleucine patch superfamily)